MKSTFVVLKTPAGEFYPGEHRERVGFYPAGMLTHTDGPIMLDRKTVAKIINGSRQLKLSDVKRMVYQRKTEIS